MIFRLAAFLLLFSLAHVSADTFAVTNTSDSGPGSLRQAITDANAHPNASVIDIISFNIPGTGVRTITVASALPEITDGVLINGWSQPGFQDTPLIELTAGAGVTVDGLRVSGSSSKIRGLIINGFQSGIFVSGFLNTIHGCFVGTNKLGTQAAPNGWGIVVAGGFRNLIGGGGQHEGNVISGNRETGIAFGHRVSSSFNADLPPDRNIVQGNFIGTDKTGTVAVPNGGDGVSFVLGGGFPGGGPPSSNRVGGTTSTARNIISGNLGNGIRIADEKSRETIQGNFIGTAADGTTPMGNLGSGILFNKGSATVGAFFGPARLDAGNVIAFNGGDGITVTEGSGHLSANSIRSNVKLGIDAHGFQTFPVISAAFASNGQLTIYGDLNSRVWTDFVLDFYANAVSDSSGFGEGEVFLGQGSIMTNGSGHAAFNVTFPLPANVTSVAATATGPSVEGTSEFSPAVNIALATPTNPPTGPTYVAPAVKPTQLLNLSTRLRVETGQGVLIGGVIVSGSAPKKIIVRAIGPSLAASNVAGFLADPVLELYDSAGQLLAQNDNWRQNQEAEIQNSGLAPSHESESAIVRTVAPGSYTAMVRGKDGTAGVALVEAYDLAQSSASNLGNVSTRGLVGLGDNVMIGGFIAGGSNSGPTTVAIRGLGPSLASFGITNPLADPTVELRNANGVRIQSNNEWADDQGLDDVRASGLAPENVHEAMLLWDVTPGNYTVILKGTSNGTGVGVLEIFNLR